MLDTLGTLERLSEHHLQEGDFCSNLACFVESFNKNELQNRKAMYPLRESAVVDGVLPLSLSSVSDSAASEQSEWGRADFSLLTRGCSCRVVSTLMQ